MSTFSNKTWIANYPDYTPENITENHATILDLYEKQLYNFLTERLYHVTM